MKKRYILFGAIIFAIWHGLCHFNNWYFEIWWADIVAHVIAGMEAGIIWWWLLEKRSSLDHTASKFFAINIVTFSTTVSVFWEFWEFSNWRYPFLRNTIGRIQQQYYPYWGNNLGDIFWGLIGGSIIALIYVLYAKRFLNEKKDIH
jgi:hypothetical protein